MPLIITDIQGTRNDQRLGRQVYLHGFRFTVATGTDISAAYDNWQNGHYHFALCQAVDDSFLTGSMKPTFSSPIGDPTNDQKSFVPYDDPTLDAIDVRKGKLKNDEYRVITHRKYFVGKNNSFQPEKQDRTYQFYIPIKKNIQFETNLDQQGLKPFFLLLWYVPDNGVKEDALMGERKATIVVRHTAYFKTHP